MGSVVALAGMMGSGKTRVGRLVAERLDCAFVDLDSEIEQRISTTITEMFRVSGEDAFRRTELETLEAVLRSAVSADLTILALGGGTVTQAAAVRLLEGHCCSVVWLDAETEEAWERVAGTERPLAQDRREFFHRAHTRRSAYEAASSVRIPVGGRSPEDVAEEVRAWIRGGAEI